MDLAKMPHFRAALRLSAKRGTCFHRSVAFVLDVPQAHLELGTFRAATDEERAYYREHRPEQLSSLSPVPFIHAWTVIGDHVVAPTLYERQGFGRMPRENYLQVNGATDVTRVLRARVKQVARDRGLSAHLLRAAPLPGGETLGGVLLEIAGVAWTENDLGGVIPA